jgi:hypothetical protein
MIHYKISCPWRKVVDTLGARVIRCNTVIAAPEIKAVRDDENQAVP